MSPLGLVSTAVLVVLSLVGPGSTDAAAAANGRIAFQHLDDASNFEIYSMAVDGSEVARLTSTPGAHDESPAWSPDGTRIAFVSRRDGNAEIYVMKADGSGQTNLTANPADDLDPEWAPDGTRIAFASARDGETGIYVMNADGAAQTRLTDALGADESPTWSPDGARIAFTSTRDSDDEIYVMNADGGAQANLTNTEADDFDPDWSPDGSRLVFESDRADGNFDVFVMSADGSGQANLTGDSLAFEADPAWSPDGSKVVFSSGRDDPQGEIYVMNADGSGVTRLTNDAVTDFSPDWQPVPGTNTGTAAGGSTSASCLSGTSSECGNTAGVNTGARLGKVTINNGAYYTNERRVRLTIVAPSSAKEIRISNEANFRSGAAKSLRGARNVFSWILRPTSELRSTTVYVRFSGSGLNASQTVSDGIILDRTPPRILSALVLTPVERRVTTPAPFLRAAPLLRLHVDAKDPGSGVAMTQIADDPRSPGPWRAYTIRTNYRSSGPVLFARVRDRAGNVSGWHRLVERQPPVRVRPDPVGGNSSGRAEKRRSGTSGTVCPHGCPTRGR